MCHLCQIWVYPEKVTENSTSFCHSKTPNKQGWHHIFIPTISLISTTTKKHQQIAGIKQKYPQESQSFGLKPPNWYPKIILLTSLRKNVAASPHKLVHSGRAWHPLSLFPGQRTMWNVPPREPSWQLKVVKFEWEFSMAKSCGFFKYFFFGTLLVGLAWTKEGCFCDVFLVKVEIYVQPRLVLTLHMLHTILLCVSNWWFTFLEN